VSSATKRNGEGDGFDIGNASGYGDGPDNVIGYDVHNANGYGLGCGYDNAKDFGSLATEQV
jgi:hypothetical protein